MLSLFNLKSETHRVSSSSSLYNNELDLRNLDCVKLLHSAGADTTNTENRDRTWLSVYRS